MSGVGVEPLRGCDTLTLGVSTLVTMVISFSDSRYELGPGLYIGWAGGSLELIGGICLCLSCKAARGATGNYTYRYRAPRSTPGAGTVSRKWTSEVDNSSNYGKNAYV
ncbi:hypothetical protein scyTo_0023926 [Scyliorhinus torazame]|uniref:Uncharacterized protein n=1 Tax=Scyliorhinus torazame TaxID=75743 RepID=A0A401QD44_SCYTO|nr:hypothetical protein [Scyliorhinus torazame]